MILCTKICDSSYIERWVDVWRENYNYSSMLSRIDLSQSKLKYKNAHQSRTLCLWTVSSSRCQPAVQCLVTHHHLQYSSSSHASCGRPSWFRNWMSWSIDHRHIASSHGRWQHDAATLAWWYTFRCKMGRQSLCPCVVPHAGSAHMPFDRHAGSSDTGTSAELDHPLDKICNMKVKPELKDVTESALFQHCTVNTHGSSTCSMRTALEASLPVVYIYGWLYKYNDGMVRVIYVYIMVRWWLRESRNHFRTSCLLIMKSDDVHKKFWQNTYLQIHVQE